MVENTDSSEQLRAQYKKYKQIVNSIEDGYYEVDLEGHVTFANAALVRMVGFRSYRELLGLHYKEFTEEENAKKTFAAFNEVYRTGVPNKGYEWVITDARGEDMYLRASISPMIQEDGSAAGFRGVVRDVTAQRLAEMELERRAYTDPITGLPNRLALEERFSRYEDDTEFGLLCLEIARMGSINIMHGYRTGDRVQRVMGERLAEIVEEGDLARIRGGEFACIMKNTGKDLIQRVHDLKGELDRPVEIEGKPVKPEVIGGISFYPEHGSTLEALLQSAEVAGLWSRNNWPDAHSLNTLNYYLQLEKDLEGAIDRDELELYCHPLVDPSSGRYVGFENLLRWHHPEFGMVPPDDFIPIAERNAYMARLTEQVVDKACGNFHYCIEHGKRPELMTINISARDLYSGDIEDMITHHVDAHDISASAIGLELTETSVMYDPEKSFARLGNLAAQGFNILIDDFGCGYSSLMYLNLVPKDALVKIDKQFLRGIPEDAESEQLMTGICSLVQSLGMRVVPEGVETEEQENFVYDLGAYRCQGFFYNKPVPISDIVDELPDE